MIADRIADELLTNTRTRIDTLTMTVYLRKAHRMLNSRPYATLDLADVEVQPEYRRRGLFSSLMVGCEVAAGLLNLEAVYVECIHNSIVADALTRRGYVLVEECGPDVHMFKPLKPRDIGG